MGRPVTPIGAWGNVNSKAIGPKKWCAETRFHNADGTYSRVERTRPTKTAAENALKEKLVRLQAEVRGTVINGETRFRRVAELWARDLDQAVAVGDMAESSARQFKSYLKNWVVPAFGALQMSECTTLAFESLIDRVYMKRSFDTASSVKTVLVLLCQYAVRHKAFAISPAASMKKLKRKSKKKIRSLDFDQRTELIAKLEKLAKERQTDVMGRDKGIRGRVWADLPDEVRVSLATGVRIGELVAILGDGIDVANRTVTVDGHVVPKSGVGLVREPYRKGGEESHQILVLRVPDWAMPMLIRRKLASGGGPIFTSSRDGWVDPVALGHRMRDAFDEVGFDWVTNHILRKTTAAVLDEAGLPSSVVAAQLGNSEGVVRKHYVHSKVANTGAAEALEGMF